VRNGAGIGALLSHYMKKAFLLWACWLVAFVAQGQPVGSQNQNSLQLYLETYREAAIREMWRSGVPASITLAQGVLESSNGQSALATQANNHFGIKCHDWKGETYIQDDETKNECFRKYNTVQESYADHSDFLRGRPRYAKLFLLDRTDYVGWAKGLKECGYATNPNYPTLLINLIDGNSLHQYDQVTNEETLALLPKKQDGAAPTPAPANTATSTTSTTHANTAATTIERPEAFNGVMMVTAHEGDNALTIAERYGQTPGQVVRNNDLAAPTEAFAAGEHVFLQPKRRKGEYPIHTVAAGETMRTISQQHGIRLRFLRKKNHLKEGQEPATGETLWLRTGNPDTPKLRPANAAIEPSNNPAKGAIRSNAQPSMITQTGLKRLPNAPDTGFVEGVLELPVKPEPKATPKPKQETHVATPAVKPPIQEPLSPTPAKSTPADTATEKPFENEYVEQEQTNVQAVQSPAKTPLPAKGTTHTVAKGETLYSISKQFGISVQNLKDLNELEGNDLKVGQVLVVGE